ncbi:hypothetical protein AAFF_G00435840 [Aldrovandia affinis]|uniref:AIG1-type G domain-containing protein n=1 Tax=Aldrovandia affinis TaxID=143900 RepID=A0AAD7R317_9TELE|nr:hypothetical protein AAFF_G00435840 [Aldrovandia affinis]
MTKVQKQRKALRALFEGEEHRLSELRIVLLGGRVNGKSSAGNTILGREEFESGIITAQCVKRQGEVAGRQVTVVDTPGWWYSSVKHTRELDKQEIVRSVSLCPPGPYALFLVIDVSSSFTELYRRSVEEHLEFLSERVWRHTIVLFTWGDCLGDTTIEQHIETEGKALQWLVEKCGNRYHVLNNENRGDGTQVTELLEKIEETVARNKSGHFTIEESDEGFKQKRVNKKQLKQKFEEEWSRREQELLERMATVVFNSETEGSTLPVRKRRNSMDIIYCPPSMSGGTPAPSEAGSSVRGYESAHKRSKQNVSWWLNRSKTERSVPSGYGTRSSVVSEAKCKLEKDSDTQLLEKREETVARNRSGHFTIEGSDEGFKQWFKGEKVDEKQLKQKFEEEWRRREEEWKRVKEEPIERMGTVVLDSETEGSTLPVRKRRNSMDIGYRPPSMSGGTPAPSEAGSSVRGYESAHKRSKQNV